MPLRAKINNQDVISVDHSHEQWEELKKEIKRNNLTVYLSCCGGKGFLRTSKLGLKHFAHKKSEHICDWKPESPEHLWIKKAIIEGCIAAGWSAVPEFSGDTWRADVYAYKGNVKIAFEVQWSPQTYEETRYRQERYKTSGVRGCWFFRTPAHKMRTHFDMLIQNKSIPTFLLKKDEKGECYSEINNCKIEISDLVKYLLSGNVNFRECIEIEKGKFISMNFFKTSCWKCKKEQHLWTLPHDFISPADTKCGFPLYHNYFYNKNFEFDLNPIIIKSVFDYCNSELGAYLKIGKPKVWFDTSIGEKYLVHSCFYCKSIFGTHYLFHEKFDFIYSNGNKQIKLSESLKIPNKHWCFSKEFNFCSV